MKIGLTSSTYENFLAILIFCCLKKYKNCEFYLIKKKNKSYFKEFLRKNNLMILFRKFKHKFNYNIIEKEVILKNSKLESLFSYCKKNKIKIIKLKTYNSKEDIKNLEQFKLDLIINCGGGIFRKKFISIPKIGIINTHMGMLPKYRGMNVLEWSIYNDDPIGVTLHFIDEGIDTGDIISFKEIIKIKGDNLKTLREKSNLINVELIESFVNDILEGKQIKKTKQLKEEGKQYYKMPDELLSVVISKLN